MQSLANLHGLARCGGTIISRCIGCMENIAMLHEIHPDGPSLVNNLIPESGHRFNALLQAVSWYPYLFTDEERLQIISKKFEDNDLAAIKNITHRVSNHGMTLVLRNWPHIDFIGKPFLENPTYKQSLRDMLSEHFVLNNVYILRHLIEQFLSMIHSGSSHSYLSSESGIRHYLKGYRAYADIAVKHHFIKYEDFLSSPEITIRLLSDQLQIPFDSLFIDKWSTYKNVVGDSARMSSSDISPTPRRSLNPAHQKVFTNSDDYHHVTQLFDYSC